MDNLITCYRCGGERIIYKYELHLGSNTKCPGCKGSGSINPNLCIKCIKCDGTGKIYEFGEEIGQKIECPLCKNMGYTTNKYLECPKCKGDGKVYPFQNEKLGVPNQCNICSSIGWIQEKDYNKIKSNYNINNNIANNNRQNNVIPKFKINKATQGQANPFESIIQFCKNNENLNNDFYSGGNSIYEPNSYNKNINNNYKTPSYNVPHYNYGYPNSNINNYNQPSNYNYPLPGPNNYYQSGYNINNPHYPSYPANYFNNFNGGNY